MLSALNNVKLLLMKVAAYQAPLRATSSMDVLYLISEQVDWCESNGVEILCCPEGVLGGLADYAGRPIDIAIDVEAGQLHRLLAQLESDEVGTIIGVLEIERLGRQYISAAVLYKGSSVGGIRWHISAI